jgi:thymidylate kinase
MLALVKTLFDELRNKGVSYCHWKSNASLTQALNGEGDLDLLIAVSHQQSFKDILVRLGFKRGIRPDWERQDGIAHYYGLDAASGLFVHLHVYDSLLTGGSLVKKYHFPVEASLLEDARASPEGIKIPLPEQELALLVVRKMLEHAYLPERLLLMREKSHVRHEVRWLLERTSGDAALATAAAWWPDLKREIFVESLRLLETKGPGSRGSILGYRLRSALRPFEIFPRFQAAGLVWTRFFRRSIQKFLIREKTQSPDSGGTVIAVIGPDATGKSTVAGDLRTWLFSAFKVRTLHLGKPPATWVTWPARALLPFAKALFPRHRTSEVEQAKREAGEPARPSLLYGLRRLMIAYERERASRKALRWASRGALVVCDRYPSPKNGAMDGPQLAPTAVGLLGRMAAWEAALYDAVPPPDLVLQLSVPVAAALERNRARRDKPLEEDAYIASRHLQEVVPPAPKRVLCRIETSGPLCETLAAAKAAIWKAL